MLEAKVEPKATPVESATICHVCGAPVETTFDSTCRACNRPVHVRWDVRSDQPECGTFVANAACCGISVLCNPCAKEQGLG